MVVVNFIQAHWSVIVGFGLFIVSEVMALVPSIKANGIAQMVLSFFKDQAAKNPQALP